MQQARTARSRRTRSALVAAVRDELRRNGAFTGESVAERAGCSPATYYVHLPTKDDALAAAFGLVLADLDALGARLFDVEQLAARGVPRWCEEVVGETIGFFATETLVFRAALARLADHRRLRSAYRATEQATLTRVRALVGAGQERRLLAAGSPDGRAEAALVLVQGLNNPRLWRRGLPDAVPAGLAAALRTVLDGPAPGGARG